MTKLDKASRIAALRELSDSFFQKSSACTKVSDVASFFELAQKASEKADMLEDESRIESCWVYLQFIDHFQYENEYENYLEFCIRNGLFPVSNEDYKRALEFVAARGDCPS